jgi:2-polyprenyl-6-methoxyphenol hydroxylase-like FAD-dependent oxidoreductase
MSHSRALIIGGSLGGLIAAHLLRGAGWDAVVFERNAEDLPSRGAGIGTHPHLIDILRRAGIAFDDSMGVRVATALALDCDGRVALRQDTERMMSGWARLYRSLREALPADRYRLNHTLARVEQDAAGVTALFAGGARERGDLLLGADGIRSTVRGQFRPDAQPVYAGYIAWRAMVEERDIPEDIRREVFASYAFCLPEGEQCLGYPVPGRDNATAAGRRAYNIVWYRPTDAATALVDLCTDAAGHCHGVSIPPPLIRPDVIAAIKATARDVVAPQIAEIFARSEPFFQPIYDLESAQIAFGRVALIGDAAFVARPHVGAGVTKAALDAAALVDALIAHDNDIDAAMARYSRAQIGFGRGLVALGRDEGAYISAAHKPPHERRGAELPRDIHSLMAAHHASRDRVRALAAARG